MSSRKLSGPKGRRLRTGSVEGEMFWHYLPFSPTRLYPLPFQISAAAGTPHRVPGTHARLFLVSAGSVAPARSVLRTV
ncbi:INPP5K isoform 20 [Pan troglodytes]|uniref:INPP5K isoform 20 n=1 Tax=Pan troglodytes TaxID=9598 RepID=A0A2J8JKP6_PANTR|nr:INPP5K isoform 20 [Pan troglodytes]